MIFQRDITRTLTVSHDGISWMLYVTPALLPPGQLTILAIEGMPVRYFIPALVEELTRLAVIEAEAEAKEAEEWA